MCVSKLCACVRRRAGGGRRRAGVHNQEQEPHTKMWRKSHFVSANLPAECFVFKVFKGNGVSNVQHRYQNISNIQSLSPGYSDVFHPRWLVAQVKLSSNNRSEKSHPAVETR